ncbi:MAG: hypothetical protein VXY23_03000 [Pseudomonadota bacterium]|nr:hypothetical protein [Pseudomonadota bacterium]
MFWKKRKYRDYELGELTFSCRSWQLETLLNGDELYVDIEGTKDRPDSSALRQAKNLLANITKIRCAAEEYVATAGVEHFTVGHGKLILDGLTSYKDEGRFDLGFGLSDWDDAIVVVQFIDGKPRDIQIGD